MKIVCDLIQADVPTLNGRIYSKKIMEQCIENTQEKIKNRQLFITQTDKPSPKGIVNLEDCCAVITELKLNENNKFEITVESLSGFKGPMFDKFIKYCDVSPFGIGTVDQNNNIGEDYKLISFNLYPKQK
jgi:hypothetical protein